MGTLITDPNAAPDPNEVAPIPDHQSFGDQWVGRTHNPVSPGAPPSADYPIGVPSSADEALAVDNKPPPMAKQMPAPPEAKQMPAPEPLKPEPKHDKTDDKHAAHKK